MGFRTKINFDDDKLQQAQGQSIVLSGYTSIASSGELNYVIHPTFTGNTQIVDKKYVDDAVLSITGGSMYNLASPSTITVGGIVAGTILTGKSTSEILKEILVPYISPSFSSFTGGVDSLVEVGCAISGSTLFTWTFANSSNVQSNSMCIRDVSNSTTLATDISTTSPQSTTITPKTFTSCGDTQIWCGSAKNSCNLQFNSSSYTVSALLPYYWGVCTCPGGAGENRPTATCDMVTGGTKILAGSSGSININFNSTNDDYLWFAVPGTVADKTCWYITALNNGIIGGGVGAACNLFPSANTISVTTTCWSGCSYDVYVSNKQTSTSSTMTLS